MKYALPMIGAVLGGIAGYLMYSSIGCRTGTCPILSNPWISVAFGAIAGGVLASAWR
jgi:outer membrane lipoprotein SlyB